MKNFKTFRLRGELSIDARNDVIRHRSDVRIPVGAILSAANVIIVLLATEEE